MSTYNPYDGRPGGTVKVKYMINLPPDIKITESTINVSTPILQNSCDTYHNQKPVSYQADTTLTCSIPVKASNDFKLTVAKPVIQMSADALFYRPPQICSDDSHISLSIDNPVLHNDPGHVSLHQTEPLLVNNSSNTKLFVEETPRFALKKLKSTLQWALPVLTTNRENTLEKNHPVLSKNKATTLCKSNPKLMCKKSAVLEKNFPRLSTKSMESTLTNDLPDLILTKTEFEKNDPEMQEVSTVLKQSVPEIVLVEEILEQSVPLMEDQGSELELNKPLTDLKQEVFEMNRPDMSSCDFDLTFPKPLYDVRIEEVIHNLPLLVEFPEEFLIATPTLEEE